MPKVTLHNQTGAEVGEIELDALVFGLEPHESAMTEAVIMQRAAMRQGTHKVKGRSEVRGGGRKPWRQKGTGRARQGTIRAPQWRGGGVVFGPTPRSYGYKLPKKVRRLALKSALSMKVKDGNMIVLDQFAFDAPKTKEFVQVLNNLKAENQKALVVTADFNENVALSGRNIPGVTILESTGVNVLDLVAHKKLIMTQDAVKQLEEVLG